MNFPTFSDKEIFWHEGLHPLVVNVYQGKLYIVGRPPRTSAFRKYGASNPPYAGFVWEARPGSGYHFSAFQKQFMQEIYCCRAFRKRARQTLVWRRRKASRSDITRHRCYALIPNTKLKHIKSVVGHFRGMSMFDKSAANRSESLTVMRRATLACGLLLSVAGCAQTVEWREDVRFLDGQVVTVTQKRRCEGGDVNAKTDATCLARDAWVTMRLPELSGSEIVWHESLNPMVINVFEGALYIVGTPPTSVEFRKYGAVNPPYYGFVWKGGEWTRIPFSIIPTALYQGNMLIESIPKTRTDHVTLELKKSETGCCYRSQQRRIDPARVSTKN